MSQSVLALSTSDTNLSANLSNRKSRSMSIRKSSFALRNGSILNTQYNELILPPPTSTITSTAITSRKRLPKPGLRSMLYGLSLKM